MCFFLLHVVKGGKMCTMDKEKVVYDMQLIS